MYEINCKMVDNMGTHSSSPAQLTRQASIQSMREDRNMRELAREVSGLFSSEEVPNFITQILNNPIQRDTSFVPGYRLL